MASNEIVLSKLINNVLYQVTIFTTRVEDVIAKSLTSFTPPQSTANQIGSDPGDADFGPKDTWIIDLLMLTRRFNVDGYVASDHGSGDTPGTQNAQTKRNNLQYMIYAGGTITLTYDGAKSIDNDDSFTINIEKITITENPEDTTTPNKYIIKFTAVEGLDMPARS